MTSVDERIVSLKFDNSGFAKNAQKALGILDKLKKSTNLKDSSKALDQFSKSANGFHLGGIDKAISSAKGHFSALEVAGVTALANIANSAVNAGKRMVSALTIAPVKDGFAEYELKMNSVQTIMASTGADIKTVNKYLEELNHYADKTIYSFSDMTSNIGKFTNAGVDLDTAVKAIQGISNEAALSGANAQQASHAMYNFAQALSAGYVKLIDWKSIEVANMATKQFKQELLDTALALGTVVKKGDDYVSTTTNAKGNVSDAFNATKNFNDSLNHQWMTTEVLTTTLSRYSNTQEALGKKAFAAAQDIKTFSQLMDTLKEAAGSGWATTFELIFGDKEEAKKMWTGLNSVIEPILNGFAERRNKMLKEWKKLGGRDNLINAIKRMYNYVQRTVRPIGQAFKEMFPSVTGKQLAELTKRLSDFVTKTHLKKGMVTNLKEGASGVFAFIKTITTAITDAGKGVFGVAKILAPGLEGLYANFSSFGTILKFVADRIGDLRKRFGELNDKFGVTRKLTDLLKEFVSSFNKSSKNLNKNIKIMFGSPKDFEAAFKNLLNLDKRFKGVRDTISKFKKESGKTFEALGHALGEVKTGVVESFGDEFEKLGDTLSNKVYPKIKDFFGKHGITLPEIKIGSWGDSLHDRLSEISKSFSDFVSKASNGAINLNDKFSNKLLNIRAEDVRKNLNGAFNAIHGAINKAYKSVNTKGLRQTLIDGFNGLGDKIAEEYNKGIGKISKTQLPELKFGNWLDKVVATLADFGKWVADGAKKFIDFVKAIADADNPIDVLLKGLKKVGDAIKGVFDFFKDGLGRVGLLDSAGSALSHLTDALSSFADKVTPAKLAALIFAGFVAIIGMATLELVNSISYMFNSIGGFFGSAGGLMTSVKTLVDNLTNSVAPLKKAKTAWLEVASAIAIMVASLYVLTKLAKEKTFDDAIVVLTLITAALWAFVNLSNNSSIASDAGAMGANVIAIAAAVFIVAEALREITKLELNDDLKWKLGILAGAMIVLAGIAVGMSRLSGKGFSLESALNIAVLAASMYTIVGALNELSKIDLTSSFLTDGKFSMDKLAANAAGLLKLVIALAAIALVASKISWTGGLGLLLAAKGLEILVPVLDKLKADIDFDAILKAIEKYKLCIIGMGAILTLLALALASKAGAVLTNNIKAIGRSMLAMAGAIAVMVGSIYVLGKMKSNELKKGLAAVSLLMIVMGGILAVLGYLNKNGVDIKGAGATLIGMSIAISLLLASIYVLGTMDADALKQGELAVAGLAAILGGFLKAANGFTTSKHAYKDILAATASIILLGGMLIVLSFIDFPSILKGLIALGSCTACLVAVMNSMKGMKAGEANEGIKALIFTVGAMVGITLMLMQLAKQPWQSLIAGALGLSMATLALAAAAKTISSIKTGNDPKALLGQLATLGEVILAMVGISAMLYLLSESAHADKMLEVGVALSALTATLALVTGALATIGAGGAASIKAAAAGALAFDIVVADILAIVAVVAGLANKIGEFNRTHGMVLSKNMQSFGDIIGSGIEGLMSHFKPQKQEKQVETFADKANSVVKAIQDSLKALTDCANSVSKFKPEQIKSIGQVFSSVGEMFKPFLTADVLKAIVSDGFSIDSIVSTIGSFSKLGPALSSLSNIVSVLPSKDKLSINQIETLNQLVPMLTKVAELAQKVPVDTTLTKYGPRTLEGKEVENTSLTSFVKQIAASANSIKELGALEIDDSAPEKAKMIADSVSSILSVISGKDGNNLLPDTKQVDNNWYGDTTYIKGSIDQFAEQIKAAGESLATLNDVEITDDEGGVKDKVDIISKILKELIAATTEDGMAGAKFAFPLNDGLSKFCTDIATAAKNLAPLKDAEVDDSTVYKVRMIGKVVNSLTQLGSGGSKGGGLFSGLKNLFKGFGENANLYQAFNKLSIVAGQLKMLTAAGGPLDGLDGNAIGAKLDGIVPAFEKLKSMSEATKGLKFDTSSISGLDTFAQTLKTAAPKLADFSKDAAKISGANVYKAKNAITIMSEAAGSCGNGKALDTFAKSCKKLGNSLADFSNQMGIVDVGTISTKLQEISSINVDASNFEAFSSKVKSAIKSALAAIKPEQFKTKGTACVKAFAGAIKSAPVHAAAKKASSEGATGALASRSSWESAGRSCVEGLASGIRNASWIATNAATIVAQQAVSAANAALKVNSPSKVFMKIGASVDEGFAKGMTKPANLKMVRNSVVRMANYAVKSAPVKQIVKTFSKSSALVNQTPKTFAQSFGKSFVKALHKLPKKTNKALHKLIDVKNFDKKHILKQGQSLVKTYRTALNKASIATKAKYSPFNANALIKTKNGLEATATYLAASVKNGKISNALATTSKTLVKKINTLFKAGVKSGKWGKNSKSGMKKVTEQIIKDATEGYNNLQRLLAKLPKKYAKIMNQAASAVGKFIANNKSVTKYASGAITQFDKIYGDELTKSRKANTKVIKQWDSDMLYYRNERARLTMYINGNKGKKLTGSAKKQFDDAKKQLKVVNQQIADLTKVKGKINALRKENKKYSSVKSVVQSFAEQLYYNSSEGKQEIKSFKKAADNYEKARTKQQKQQKKLDNWDKKNGKRYNALRKKDTKSLSDGEKKELKKLTDQRKKISKELDKLKKDTTSKLKALNTESGKLGKGVEKAFKTFRNEIKSTVKAMGALSTVKLSEDLFSGINWESQTESFDVFSAAVSKSLDEVSTTTTTVKTSIQAAAEAFDVLSNSFSTGIDIFDKFTNTGTADPKALMEYIDSQNAAFDEWFSMMEELEKRGLDSSVLEILESNGISSINRVRGFYAMSEEQLAQYNEKVKHDFDNQTKMLSRSTKKQNEEYSKWMANVEKLQTQKGDIISKDLIDKIRAAGVSSAKTVELLLNMTDDALREFSSYYSNATSDVFVNFASIEKAVGEASKKAGQEAGEDTVTGFVDALTKAQKEEAAWQALLDELSGLGFSKEVVDKFREMGRESGTAWAETLIKEVNVDRTSDQVKALIKQADELEATLNTMTPGDAGYNDIVQQITDIEAQAKAAMMNVVNQVNQAVADSIPNPVEAAIKNLEEENKAYDDYKKNVLKIESEIGNAKTEDQKKLKKVYESLADLGFSEADGIKYLANATVDQVDRLYTQLEKREKNNKENRTANMFGDYHKIRKEQQAYAKNIEWLSENVFSPTSNSGLSQANRIKAQKELLDQIRAMSIEDANAYIEALKYGQEHENADFSKWQKDFFASNFSIPSTVADQVAAESAAIYTGFVNTAGQTLSSGASVINNAIATAASRTPNGKAKDAITSSSTTVAKKAVDVSKNYVTSKAPEIGISFVEGIPKGMKDKAANDKLIKACEGLGSTVTKTTKKALKSNSPSKVFIQIGKDVNEGLAIGVKDNMSMPTEAATTLADQVTQYAAMAYGMITQLAENETIDLTPRIELDGLAEQKSEIESYMDILKTLLAIASGEVDTNPVITPALDLTQVRKEAQGVNSLFENTQANIRALATGENIQNADPNGMTFIQNNYSPKALDRLEIYRQTNNQFAMAKGLVNRR